MDLETDNDADAAMMAAMGFGNFGSSKRAPNKSDFAPKPAAATGANSTAVGHGARMKGEKRKAEQMKGGRAGDAGGMASGYGLDGANSGRVSTVPIRKSNQAEPSSVRVSSAGKMPHIIDSDSDDEAGRRRRIPEPQPASARGTGNSTGQADMEMANDKGDGPINDDAPDNSVVDTSIRINAARSVSRASSSTSSPAPQRRRGISSANVKAWMPISQPIGPPTDISGVNFANRGGRARGLSRAGEARTNGTASDNANVNNDEIEEMPLSPAMSNNDTNSYHDSTTINNNIAYTSPNGTQLTQSDLNHLRNGVRIPGGGTAYFQPSFLDDPWGGMTAVSYPTDEEIANQEIIRGYGGSGGRGRGGRGGRRY